MRYAKQCRYESFLASVQQREEAAIKAALPGCLARLVEIIKEVGGVIDQCQDVTNGAGTVHTAERTKANWNDKSLPKLRELYAKAKNPTSSLAGLQAVEEMAMHLSGWNRRTGFRVDVVRTTKNDSYRHDPKAVRIDSVTVVKTPTQQQ